MLRFFLSAALAAASISPASAQAGAQPTPAEIEAALLAHQVHILSYLTCRPARSGCIKPPKRMKVRNYDCQATGTDKDGGPVQFCRTTYIHSGGSMANVLSRDECIALRARGAEAGGWEVAMVETKGKCPGARE